MAILRNLSFSVDEYRSRVARVQRRMLEQDLDALLCHDFASICYLTGFQSIMGTAKYFMAVVPREGAPCLLGQDFELYNARIGCWLDDLVPYAVFADPVAASRALLLERGLSDKRLGLELRAPCLTPECFAGLREAIRRAELLDASDLVS